MKKYSGIIRTLALSVMVSLGLTATAFAGYWVPHGNSWQYMTDGGQIVTSKGPAQIYSVKESMYSYAKYCMGPDGTLKTGWVQINGDWFYFAGSGAALTNEWVGGRYYVDRYGRMMTNAVTPDGYYVGADGAWVPGANVGGEIASGTYRQVSSQTVYSSIDYSDTRYENDDHIYPLSIEFSTMNAADEYWGPAKLTVTKSAGGTMTWLINDGNDGRGVFTRGANGVYSGEAEIMGPEWGVERITKLPDGRIQVDVFGEGDGGWVTNYIFE